MIIVLLAVQAAVLPDISLHATVKARSLHIEEHGEAKLEVRADPDAGSLVKVEAPKANGAATLRNVTVNIDAEARIGKKAEAVETDTAAPR
jgi:hypothetical protein